MAGLAAVTEKIKLFASTAILTLPPAIAARMATTIDSIAPGRFGINIVTGWQMAEYDQVCHFLSHIILDVEAEISISPNSFFKYPGNGSD